MYALDLKSPEARIDELIGFADSHFSSRFPKIYRGMHNMASLRDRSSQDRLLEIYVALAVLVLMKPGMFGYTIVNGKSIYSNTWGPFECDFDSVSYSSLWLQDGVRQKLFTELESSTETLAVEFRRLFQHQVLKKLYSGLSHDWLIHSRRIGNSALVESVKMVIAVADDEKFPDLDRAAIKKCEGLCYGLSILFALNKGKLLEHELALRALGLISAKFFVEESPDPVLPSAELVSLVSDVCRFQGLGNILQSNVLRKGACLQDKRVMDRQSFLGYFNVEEVELLLSSDVFEQASQEGVILFVILKQAPHATALQKIEGRWVLYDPNVGRVVLYQNQSDLREFAKGLVVASNGAMTDADGGVMVFELVSFKESLHIEPGLRKLRAHEDRFLKSGPMAFGTFAAHSAPCFELTEVAKERLASCFWLEPREPVVFQGCNLLYFIFGIFELALDMLPLFEVYQEQFLKGMSQANENGVTPFEVVLRNHSEREALIMPIMTILEKPESRAAFDRILAMPSRYEDCGNGWDLLRKYAPEVYGRHKVREPGSIPFAAARSSLGLGSMATDGAFAAGDAEPCGCES